MLLAFIICFIFITFRQALAETNALLARALALHFAGDASNAGGGGAVRRACCALAFQDVADVRVSCRGRGGRQEGGGGASE